MQTEPRKRDADRSRAEILDAAERLFAEHGFDSVTMADIGAAAGVSRGTPGYFFGQKEQLYRVVLERAATTFRMLGETLRLRDVGGQRDRATILSESVQAFVGLLVARRDLVRLLDRDGGASGAPHALAVREALAGLSGDTRAIALTIVALAWYPVSQPQVAAAVGVDVTQPDFPARWTALILTVVDGVSAAGDPFAQQGYADETISTGQAEASAGGTPVDPTRRVVEIVTGGRRPELGGLEPLRKKKKKKKKKHRDDETFE